MQRYVMYACITAAFKLPEYGEIFSRENTDAFKVVDVTHGRQRVWTFNAHLVKSKEHVRPYTCAFVLGAFLFFFLLDLQVHLIEV